MSLDRIREGVRRFRTEVFPRRRRMYEALAEKQHPFALFLTCGDSRIDPCLLTGTNPGDIFVERTPGNIVPVYDDAASVGVSASIEYAVAVLGVDEIIVCGHSACGAMSALLHPGHLGAIPATARWLRYADPALRKLAAEGTAEAVRLERLTELNVIAQMENLHTHPAVQQRVEAGRLGIHGWIYDIPTGVVQAWDSAAARFAPWPE
jgi:carbonic anhydrase